MRWLLLAWLALLPYVAKGQELVVREAPIKAAYLYNFAKYVQVPTRQPGGPVTIGIVGDSAVTAHLQTIAERKTVNGRPLKIETFSTARTDFAYDLVFISRAASEELQLNTLAVLHEHSTFIVADISTLIPSVDAAFVSESNRLRFDINLRRSKTNGVQISSQLLKLARTIHEEKQSL